MGPYAARKRVVYYSVPFTTFHFAPNSRELIIGAGSGSDADVALHNGIKDITAVELDPTIYTWAGV
jgi:spermidine synthase